jgi:hypothetical protein
VIQVVELEAGIECGDGHERRRDFGYVRPVMKVSTPKKTMTSTSRRIIPLQNRVVYVLDPGVAAYVTRLHYSSS